ncbi:MAG: flagellar hook-associated protein FlgK [Clostridium sp.]|nr:flagellar hook-associated protein FlgK [Clostridium sp.]
MAGLFGTFNIATRGLSAAQTTIDVTSHNVANANTEGYSRQRAELETTRPMSTQLFRGQLGTGVKVSAIDRIRDTFLDYQYRTENSTLGRADVRNTSLYQIETLFNEPSDTGISTLIGKFFDSFQELAKQPNSSNARTVAVQQTVALADALNHAHTKLSDLIEDTKDSLRANAKDVNSLLDQINTLNKEIKTVSTAGQRPNDLMDRRDKLLDELSYKFNIQITNREFDGIDVAPVDDCGMKQSTLVSSKSSEDICGRISYISSVEQDKTYPNVTVITYYALGDTTTEKNKRTLRVADLTDIQKKQLESCNLIWADKNGTAVKGDGYPIGENDIINAGELKLFNPSNGEIAGNIQIQNDIRQYIDEINKLAKAIALSVNAIHSGVSNPINSNGTPNRDFVPLFVNKKIADYDINHQMTNLDNTLMAECEIDASNISINEELIYDVMKLKTKTHDNLFAYTNQNDLDGEGDGTRALQISKLRDQLLRIQDMGEKINERKDLILSNDGLEIQSDVSGMTLDSYFKDIIDKLGVKAQEATRQQKNQSTMVNSVENSRLSVSGVNLDEELSNLIQFQHAYSANAKIISTLDELLDVVVNGLKR